MDFISNGLRIQDVLKDCLNPNPVKHRIPKGKLVAVGNQLSVLRCVNIRTDEFYVRIVVKGFGTRTDRTASNYEDSGS